MNKLSITDKFILELVNMKPIIDIKQFANDYDIPYNTIRIYISKLIKSNYLIKDGEMIRFNASSEYHPLINNHYNHYIQMLEKALINNHFITNDEINALRKHLNINI